MNLEEYKEFLDLNTNDAMGYQDNSKSRYQSFKKCLEFLSNIQQPSVLELGTSRSFVGGAFVGCNSDDPKYWNPNDFTKWDFGAGAFTLIFGQTNCKLTTVDLIGTHIARCKIMTNSLGINCQHIVSDSINFLKNTADKYDLIYLDTGDMWPIEPSEDLQFEEAKIIVERKLLNQNGLILIDDVLNNTPRSLGKLTNQYGKSTKSLPYLLASNFKTLFEGHQYILSTV
jgi:spermine/spermidine synthase